MFRAKSFFAIPFLVLPLISAELRADGGTWPEESTSTPQSNKNEKGFTGRINREGVRMRLQPTLDSPVVREMTRGELVVVVGESEDFYAVKPPSKTKAFVYRPYVLDGIVEGSHVNVRLDPHLEAPVIGQLNTGDRIEGTISEKNAKWLEIPPPATTVFYIASDFVEKVGDVHYLALHEQRQSEVNNLLNSTYLLSEKELQKPFMDVNATIITQNYEKLIHEFADFPEQAEKAKKYLASFNENLLYKKIDYLEKKSALLDNKSKKNEKISEGEAFQKEALADKNTPSEEQSRASPSTIYQHWVSEKYASEVNARMALWIPVEIAYYEQWVEKNNNHGSIQEFYEEQKGQATALRGIIEAYDRPVRNKPGDYLLVNKTNRLPIAYLYSTHVNLEDKVGQEITIEGILRPNNHFAYPAYFVIRAQ